MIFDRPTIFAEENRRIWEQVRRLLIFLLHELDKAYGWNTFNKV